jgi:uncharacterized repeat protein (TIGR02543 family)
MTKKNTVYFVCLNLLLTAFMGCEGVAELFHGPKPEEVPPPVTYTVTYVANGVTGVVPPAQTVNAGTAIVLPDQGTLALSGKIFTGWNTAEDGTGTGYAARSNFTVTGGITLYAQWAIPYTVIYDANGRTGSPPPSQTAGAGTSIIVGSGSGLNKPGYGFAGWNTVADGSGIGCAAGSSLTVTGTITLYAQWVITYTVTFDANAATGVVPAVQMANAGTTIILPDQGGLVLLGKIFTGWNTAADGTGTSYMAGLSFEVNADTTLYAQWSVTPPMEYTVTYNANGGSGSLSPQTVYDGTSIIAGSGNGLSRSGYAFTGWNTAAAGTGTAYAAGSSLTVTGDITLYAQWVITYTVTFDAGEGSPSQTRTVTSGSSLGLDMPSDPTRSGYNFGGWYTAVDGGGSVFTAAATVTGSITVYAWWLDTSLQYTVTFNTGEGSPATRLVTNGSSVGSAMPSTPTKSGYSFNGWYTAANGGGSIFTAATQVTGNVTVYAWWKIQYTVTFDAAGGSPATNSRTVTDGNSIGSSAMPSTPTWSGRIFHGWYTEISGGTVFTDTTAVTANITVHARWTLDTSIQYTVTFNAAGGGPATQARTVTNGSSLGSPGMPSEPAKAGSDFNGWYTVPNGGGTEFTDATAVTANITVYAWWKMSADLSLDDALTWISNNAVTGGAYTITLQNNETIAPKTLN